MRRGRGFGRLIAMTDGAAGDETAAQGELARLRLEHRDLDAAVRALEHAGHADSLQIQRLKKRKLALKERIALIEDELNPDIIA